MTVYIMSSPVEGALRLIQWELAGDAQLKGKLNNKRIKVLSDDEQWREGVVVSFKHSKGCVRCRIDPPNVPTLHSSHPADCRHVRLQQEPCWVFAYDGSSRGAVVLNLCRMQFKISRELADSL